MKRERISHLQELPSRSTTRLALRRIGTFCKGCHGNPAEFFIVLRLESRRTVAWLWGPWFPIRGSFLGVGLPAPRPGLGPYFRRSEASSRYADFLGLRQHLSRFLWAGSLRIIRRDERP